ncbi:hypothetical protein EMPS_11494 [Entomortierella parvispora]|uniref:Uncharacterized protein n=1 Tax=Entomortierella parvispora TaxID=205924 RepID=A0A9P3M2R3_9FUNG|nr:hypothetical protein EMPS_11494 [Entomortierella parvispora]
MLAASCSRCLRDVRSRLSFVRRPFNLKAPLAPSRALSQPRRFHAGLIRSFTRNRSLTSKSMASTMPQHEAIEETESPPKETRVPWSKNELDRLQHLYSGGKNPTIQSITSFFPGRSRKALAIQLSKLRAPIPRKKWSPDEKARLVELYNAGETTIEMLNHFPGRTQESVISQLSRLRPRSYFSDRKRMVSHYVLGKENHGVNDHSSTKNQGAIVTSEELKKPRTFWTEEEDGILKRLVQRAKERNPDRWSHELSLMLSDPMERQGLAMVRTHKACMARLELLEKKPFVSKSPWTAYEDSLLRNSVCSQLGIQLDSHSKPHPDTTQTVQTDSGSSMRRGSKASLNKYQEMERWPEISWEQLKAVDWRRVVLDVGARSAAGCRDRIASHFKLKKGEHWTKEEVEKLKDGLRQYGRDYAKVATVVGTKTSAQCASKYRYQVYKANKEKK